MDPSNLYRRKSMEQISSPEQLSDYLRVTNPAVWIVLAAVALLLAGMLIWSASASIGSYAGGSAEVRDGVMTVRFEDETIAKNVAAGMSVIVGDTSSVITSVGRAEDGGVFALADTALPDGSYEAEVQYKNTQVIKLLFN